MMYHLNKVFVHRFYHSTAKGVKLCSGVCWQEGMCNFTLEFPTWAIGTQLFHILIKNVKIMNSDQSHPIKNSKLRMVETPDMGSSA